MYPLLSALPYLEGDIIGRGISHYFLHILPPIHDLAPMRASDQEHFSKGGNLRKRENMGRRRGTGLLLFPLVSPLSLLQEIGRDIGRRNIMRLVIIPFLVHVTKHVYILSLGPVLDLVHRTMIDTTAIRKTRNDTDRLLHLLIHLQLLLLILKKEEDVSRSQMTGNPLQNG